MADQRTEACVIAMAMAAPFIAMASNNMVPAGTGNSEKRHRTSSSSGSALHRTVSDVVSKELHHHHQGTTEKETTEEEYPQSTHPVPEVLQDAECECCGMSEECTPEYIRGVRRRFSGRWVCGLCAEAVTEEAEKNGAGEQLEEALRAHMGVCKRFNGFGRTHPVLFQAEAMREILRRRRAKLGPRSRSSINPREVTSWAATTAAGIARSSSCMPFTTDESNDRVHTT